MIILRKAIFLNVNINLEEIVGINYNLCWEETLLDIWSDAIYRLETLVRPNILWIPISTAIAADK